MREGVGELADNQETRIEWVKEVLRSHGIKMEVGSCGCCESPWVAFEYRGEMLLDSMKNCGFSMFEDPP